MPLKIQFSVVCPGFDFSEKSWTLSDKHDEIFIAISQQWRRDKRPYGLYGC